MEKSAFRSSHPVNSKTSSGSSSSSERGNSTRKTGRSGSQSPGSGSAGSPVGASSSFELDEAADAKEQQYWINQLQACVKSHSEGNAKIRKLKESDENLCVEKTGSSQDGLEANDTSLKMATCMSWMIRDRAVTFWLVFSRQPTMQPPQSYNIGGQRSSGQLTGKPGGARPDHRGRWCAVSRVHPGRPKPSPSRAALGQLCAAPWELPSMVGSGIA
ncbi:UNVERIFIED_CONTAM: hypothetical protein FKN15_047934 [Acipenser sinensis]